MKQTVRLAGKVLVVVAALFFLNLPVLAASPRDYFLEALMNGTPANPDLRGYYSPGGGEATNSDIARVEYWNLPEVVRPGQLVQSSLAYTIRSNANVNAIVYKTVLAEWQTNSPIALLENGESQGSPRTVRKIFSFTAPVTPGVYRVRLAMTFASQGIQRFFGDGPLGDASNPGVGHYAELTIRVENSPVQDFFLDAEAAATRAYYSPGGGEDPGSDIERVDYWNLPKVVTPGQTVQSALAYTIRSNANSNAVVYKTVLAEWQTNTPIVLLETGASQGAPRTVRQTFSFTAPSTPGLYRLRLAMTFAFQGIQHFYGDGPLGDASNPGVGHYAEVTIRVANPPVQDYFLDAEAAGTRAYYSPDGGEDTASDIERLEFWNLPRAVVAGQPMTSGLAFTIRSNANSNAVVYKTVLAEWQTNSPIALLENGGSQGSPRKVNKTFNFTAPTTPGTYRLRLAMTFAFQGIQRFFGDGPLGDVFNPGVGHYAEILVDVVTVPPAITVQPLSQTLSSGGNVTLSAGVSGSAPFTYQWLLNATNIAGATNATLTLTNFGAGQAGLYTLFVSNSVGSVTSAGATLTVFDIHTYAGLTIAGPVGANYRIDYRNDLVNTNNWLVLTNITLPSSPYLYIDLESPVIPKRFYRSVLLP
ncbi:MAG: immunoglobulin domain-containing protein [Verrucomicrobia bacterium]|nr:immunoglobulin domain-containing protein [Verrucomicrobiota bacterium]